MMVDKKRKVPNLRFKGFTDPWVQRKVSETAEVNPKTTLPDEFEYVDLGAVVGTSLNETRHEFKVSAPSRAQRLASVGDVFYQTVRPYQKNNYLFENAGITPFVFSTGYAQLRPQGDSYFLLTLLQGENFVSQVMDRSTGTSYPAINSSDLGNMHVDVPTEAEQVKIGSLFKSLDNLIAANQRKLDLLKEQKKGYLQKMFPKNGAKVPELRFAGFADDWEQRKLQEVLRERNNQQPQSMEYPLVSFTVENGVTPKTDRYEREQLVVGDKSSKKYKVTVLNDIVYNPANLKFGSISRNKYGNAVFSPIYITFLVNNDVTTPEFIEMFVTRNDFIKRALKYQQGTVYERQSVSPTDLLAMNVYLPGKSEQEKIGSFFKQLDDTIDLQHQKLAKYQSVKKSLLQQMFI